MNRKGSFSGALYDQGRSQSLTDPLGLPQAGGGAGIGAGGGEAAARRRAQFAGQKDKKGKGMGLQYSAMEDDELLLVFLQRLALGVAVNSWLTLGRRRHKCSPKEMFTDTEGRTVKVRDIDPDAFELVPQRTAESETRYIHEGSCGLPGAKAEISATDVLAPPAEYSVAEIVDVYEVEVDYAKKKEHIVVEWTGAELDLEALSDTEHALLSRGLNLLWGRYHGATSAEYSTFWDSF